MSRLDAGPEQRDAYLRMYPNRRGVVRESAAAQGARALLFVDVDGTDVAVDRLIDTFQELPNRITAVSYVLLRWPDLSYDLSPGAESAANATAQTWAETIATETKAVGYGQVHVGVVRFRVGAAPVIRWAGHADDDVPPIKVEAILRRAMQVELRTMLHWGHAIWRPQKYHYELPSGQHVGAFVRVGDAFRSPRDVRVLTTWLTPRLQDQLAIVADNATLVPVITDIDAVLRQRGWQPGRVEMLDEYPRTKFDMLRVIRPMQAEASAILGLLSVSGSGTYRDLMMEALSTSALSSERWSMVVVVDTAEDTADDVYVAQPVGDDAERISVWLALADRALNPLDEASCTLCRSHERAQVVNIDPRTFEALALPGVRLMTPDVGTARQTIGLWQSCYDAKAIGVEVRAERGPSIVSRPKSGLMGVRIDLSQLIAGPPDRLVDEIRRRFESLRDEGVRQEPTPNDLVAIAQCDGVLVSAFDEGRPDFRAVFDHVMNEVGLAGIEPTPIDLKSTPLSESARDAIAAMNHVLVFSLGCVTGWNLRQLQLAAENAWKGLHGKEIYGLVLHARPSSEREWESLMRPYRNRLYAIWRTYLPWRSPLAEEALHLNQVDSTSLSEPAKRFLQNRQSYTTPVSDNSWNDRVAAWEGGDGSPNPYAVLWGQWVDNAGSMNVRTQSNFGYEVDAITAYAAIGAAMHAARQKVRLDDPRRPVFEMPAIARSYYDGLLLASILRWCEPQEAWWGKTDAEAETVMSELIARTADAADQKVLFPELLLAASQGKVPAAAVQRLLDEVPAYSDRWPDQHQAPVELGIQLARSAATRRLDT